MNKNCLYLKRTKANVNPTTCKDSQHKYHKQVLH